MSPLGVRSRNSLFGLARPSLFFIVVALLISGAYAALVAHLREKAIADNEKQAANIAFLLAEETDRSFQSLDLVLTSTIAMLVRHGISNLADLQEVGSSQEAHLALASSLRGLPHVTNVAIVGSDGKAISRSRAGSVSGADLSGRDYFVAQREAGSRDASFVSAPAVNVATGAFSVFLSRRISGADGRFLGLVVGVFDPSSFAATYQRLGLAEKVSTIMLHRHDGVMLSRSPQVNSLLGTAYNHTASFERLIASRTDGSVQEVSPIDKEEKIVSVVNTPHFPLAQVVTLSLPKILAEWRKQAVVLGLLTLLLVGAIAAAVLLAARHARQATRFETALAFSAQRERAEYDLRQEHTRLQIALGNMRQALAMFDATGHLIICNQQYAELYKLPTDLVTPGASIQVLLNYRVTVGTARAGEEPYKLPDADCRLVHQLQDGRMISVVRNVLTDGGWVSTHEDVTEQQRAEERIRHVARHDPLTDLPNRLLFHEVLKERLLQVDRTSRMAVLYIDLDRFKPINDALGHEAGDFVLKEVARRLGRIVRVGDVVARIGGDEFAVVFNARKGPSEAAGLARRIVRTLSRPFALPGSGATASIGASIGISVAPRDATTPEQLVRNADLAMYHAKETARGTFSFFDPSMDEKVRLRRKLESDLRKAVKEREFEVYYQPQIDLKSGSIVGFEALLRWNHPERGLLGPSEFVQAAEELGLIVPIGEWVLGEACRTASAWPQNVKVAVNLSAVQFNIPGLIAAVDAALASAGLPARRLELEVTESVLVRDADQAVAVLRDLRGMGISIALDDFGTGYSSMSYLRLFPFDKLKIDKSFVAEIEGSADCMAIVRSATSLARSLEMQTTAEGIETDEQLRLVTENGCTQGQGYLFGKPLPLEETLALLGVSETLAA